MTFAKCCRVMRAVGHGSDCPASTIAGSAVSGNAPTTVRNYRSSGFVDECRCVIEVYRADSGRDGRAVFTIEADLHNQVRAGSLGMRHVEGVGDVEIAAVVATAFRADHPLPGHNSRSATWSRPAGVR